MATKFRFELNRDGVRQAALTSPEVRAALRHIGEQTAAKARTLESSTGDTSPPSQIELAMGNSPRRARVYVRAVGPAAAPREAKYRILGRAL